MSVVETEDVHCYLMAGEVLHQLIVEVSSGVEEGSVKAPYLPPLPSRTHDRKAGLHHYG